MVFFNLLIFRTNSLFFTKLYEYVSNQSREMTILYFVGSFRIDWNRRISNICILQEIVNDLRTVSTTFTSILVGSGADAASGFACIDISLWFPIFSVTLLLSNITFAHLLLSRQGLEENLSLVKKKNMDVG